MARKKDIKFSVTPNSFPLSSSVWTFSGFPPYIEHRVIVLAHVRQLELLHLKLDSLITIGGFGSRYLDQANHCRRGKWLVLKD